MPRALVGVGPVAEVVTHQGRQLLRRQGAQLAVVAVEALEQPVDAALLARARPPALPAARAQAVIAQRDGA